MKRLKEEYEFIRDLLESCNKKLQEEPEDMEITGLRGILFNMLDLYDEAIADLNRVINDFPNDERAYYLRSDCHFSKGEYDLAKQDYLRALKIQFKDDTEFVMGHTDKVISEATMNSKDEMADIKKIIEFEKRRVLLSYIPQFEC